MSGSVLGRLIEVERAVMPVLIYVVGALMIVDSLSGSGMFNQLADYPRAFIFIAGFALWAAADTARDARKYARRVERKLEQCRGGSEADE